jgi:hypothetical protein
MKGKRETDKQGDEQRDSTDEERDRMEDVVAANRELRARVDELETALTDLTEALAEGDQDDSKSDVNRLSHEVDDTPELATSGGQPTKVIGRLSDTDGIGVLGEATGSGATNGVRGVTGADGDTANNVYPRGVFGEATGSSRVFGVHGKASGPGAMGVVGQATSGSLQDYNDTFPVGVVGETDYDTSETGVDGAAGVYGGTSASGTGDTYGVYADDLSASPNSLALYAKGRSRVSGIHEVGGWVDAAKGYRGAIGSSAYFPANFSVTSSFQRLPFNTLIADQRGEFDTNNNLFECAYDGAYVVELGLESVDSGDTSGNVYVEMEILQGSAGSNPASEQAIAWNFQPNGTDFAKTFTKTIFGLKAGNQIAVKIRDTAGSLKITGSPDETFLVVRQVGGGGENTSSPMTNNVTTTDDSEQDE